MSTSLHAETKDLKFTAHTAEIHPLTLSVYKVSAEYVVTLLNQDPNEKLNDFQLRNKLSSQVYKVTI